MNWGKLFAWTICVLELAAAIGFACNKNWRLALYWFFAMALTIVLTGGE